MVISSAVRGEQMTLVCGPFLLSFLYKGPGMAARDVCLVHGVIFRNYFNQFQLQSAADQLGESDI